MKSHIDVTRPWAARRVREILNMVAYDFLGTRDAWTSSALPHLIGPPRYPPIGRDRGYILHWRAEEKELPKQAVGRAVKK